MFVYHAMRHDLCSPLDNTHHISTHSPVPPPHPQLAANSKSSSLAPETSSEAAKADPSAGLMDMMKKMYQEGDDEMKRTIAKAWTEGQDKKGMGGMDGMGCMDNL